MLTQVGAIKPAHATAVYTVTSAGDLAGFATPDTATGINDAGVIVGYERFAGRTHAFMLVPGACAADINADGFVNGDDYDAFSSAFDAGR